MSDIIVSVIVPVYNAENTINECLDSLVNQTIFDDMEVLIVDDCSADSSVLKIMDYEGKYPDHILFIKLENNGGPGNARNVAMQYARGEYIGYIDSDDAAYPQMYEKLYNEAARTGADVVDGGFYDQKNDKAILYTYDELTGKLDAEKRSGLIIAGGYIWSKLFRRQFLADEGICFRNAYVLEDFDYLTEIYAKASTIANVKEILYVYRDSEGSLSKTIAVDKYISNLTSAMAAVYVKTAGTEDYEGIREAVEYGLIQLYSYSVNAAMNAVYKGEYSKDSIIPVLTALRDMKAKFVKGGYDNKYVTNKISKKDIGIMKENDRSPADVLKLLRKD
ncbi:MAG: glycosyltransferase family 2 protein [Lachnospiraceae bacterium]|nr:glycosyltransferase family 2 protein [Lachnospiraceae bacterium]